ncbi:MAG: hypothetical protein LUG51_06905 [Tannerellaceae bacterium]|nr:hypothetical protein [Tannerellaceae bacterium]
MKKFFFLTLVFAIFSCNTGEQPDIFGYRVNLNVDLSSYQYRDLKNLYSYKIVTSPLYDGEYCGFAGILLYHGSQDIYYAYELACPYEAKKNITIEIAENGLNAECPQCGSIYSLDAGGLRVDGPTTYNLTRYQVISTSTGFTVRN